jgi:hypothetical protein
MRSLAGLPSPRRLAVTVLFFDILVRNREKRANSAEPFPGQMGDVLGAIDRIRPNLNVYWPRCKSFICNILR